MTTESSVLNRQRGTLIGLTAGDALGAAVEFKSPGTFNPVTGYRGGGPHGLGPGEWTDDSSMALALADSIGQVGWDLNDQAKRYVKWWRTGQYSVNDRCFDIGITTQQALRRFERTGNADTSGDPSERASGNGSIMRLAPVPIRFAGLFPDRLPDLVRYCVESSRPTHASPQCLSACAYFGLILAGLIHGLDRDEVLSPDWAPLGQLKKSQPLHPEILQVAAGSFREKQPPTITGSGYVVKSLEAALWAFHDASDFRDAVLRSVNLGDDADTTGAICGQLAGAFWGESGIPIEWREGLARPEMIEAALSGLLKQKHSSAAGHAGSAPGPQDMLSKIDVTQFPPRPVFLTSNQSHRQANEQMVSKALELAKLADLNELKAMKLPPSPKLKEWHLKLMQQVESQLKSVSGNSSSAYKIAGPDSQPPTASSYWVVPGLLLAGAYPGDPDPKKHAAKVQALIEAGVRTFVNLMEEKETNHAGDPFVPYADLASELCSDVECIRFPIRDLTAPSRHQMTSILDVIDRCVSTQRPVYVHCWGGVGRTGTVIACWLLRHGLANHADILRSLAGIRRQDQERGSRMSPESSVQREFVLAWSTDVIESDKSDEPDMEVQHWSGDVYWSEGMRRYRRLRESGQKLVTLDLEAIERTVYDGDGPAYRLMKAMVSVWQREGFEGYRGAPRVLLGLLGQFEAISREDRDPHVQDK